jgi:hypothetical protein
VIGTRRALAVLFAVGTISACGSAPYTPRGTDSSPSVDLAQPAITCHGAVDLAACNSAAEEALRAVTESGWSPVHVWINTGQLCPSADCLFDPAANFPYPIPPADGQWIASAEVAFAGSEQHAGMNIAAVGSELQAVLIGYRVPPWTWCPGDCPTSATTNGPFRLELVLPHLAWTAVDPISGMAIVSFTGAAPTTISGSGGDLIVFSYVEVGGNRRVDPIWTADCGPYALDPATPITRVLSKSGAVGGSEPDADFLRVFFTGPDVRLPTGTWDITAIAQFYEVAGCSGEVTKMEATHRITVADAN